MKALDVAVPFGVGVGGAAKLDAETVEGFDISRKVN